MPFKSRFAPQPIVNALVNPGDSVQLPGGPRWTVDSGEVHIANGHYYVDGTRLPTTGVVHLTEGQRVSILVEDGRRVAIIAQEVRRGSTVITPDVAVTIEGLWADETGVWYLTPTSAKKIPLVESDGNKSIVAVYWSNSGRDYFSTTIRHHAAVGIYDRYLHRVYRVTRSGGSLVPHLVTEFLTTQTWETGQSQLDAVGWPPAGWGRAGIWETFTNLTEDGKLCAGLSRGLMSGGLVSGFRYISDLVNVGTGEIVLRGESLIPVLGNGPGDIQDEFGLYPYYLAKDPKASILVVEGYSYAMRRTWTKAIVIDGTGALRQVLYPWQHDAFNTPSDDPPTQHATGPGVRAIGFNASGDQFATSIDLPITPTWLGWATEWNPGTPNPGIPHEFTYTRYLTNVRTGGTGILAQVTKDASGIFGSGRPAHDDQTRKITQFWCTGGVGGGKDFVLAAAYEWFTVPDDQQYFSGPYDSNGHLDGSGIGSSYEFNQSRWANKQRRLDVYQLKLPFTAHTSFEQNPTTGYFRERPVAPMLDEKLSLEMPPLGTPLLHAPRGLSIRLDVKS